MLNKIMFSIIVAILFAIRIYSNSMHCLPKFFILNQIFVCQVKLKYRTEILHLMILFFLLVLYHYHLKVGLNLS